METEPLVLDVDSEKLVGRVVLTAVGVEILLVFLDATVNAAYWADSGAVRRLFNITREDALPSFFAVAQTLLVAATLWAVVVVVRAGRRRDGRGRVVGWTVLAAAFTYMAVDDGAKVHERLGTALQDAYEAGSTADGQAAWQRLVEAFPSYNWQLLFLPLFAALGIFVVVFLWRELTEARSRLMVGTAVLLLALAVGLDFVEGLPEVHPWNVYSRFAIVLDFEEASRDIFRRSGYSTVVHFGKSLEEFTEMFSMTMLWAVFLEYLLGQARDLRIRVTWPCRTSRGSRSC